MAPERGELGEACDVDVDCDESLHCRYDATDFVADRQCVADCTTELECRQFGENATCADFGSCVVSCEGSADCPELTVCNADGWCQRTGPGSGIPHCTGTPTECALLSGSACAGAMGCTDDSECTGTAQYCTLLSYSIYACAAQKGCVWLNNLNSCAGNATACSGFESQGTCDAQTGCDWSAVCSGTRLACEAVPVSTCVSQAGCYVDSPPQCAPSEATCRAGTEEATLCAPDGLSQSLVVDCAATDEVCVDGECKARVCEPNTLLCRRDNVYKCNTKGDDSVLHANCGSNLYCDPETVACKQPDCGADVSVCRYDTIITCDAEGHTWLPGGVDCGDDACDWGTCVSESAREDFEDGDLSGWTEPSGLYEHTLTDDFAAAGTAHSLRVTPTATPVGSDSLTYAFSDTKPHGVGFWVRVTGQGLSLKLLHVTDTPKGAFSMQFGDTGMYIVQGGGFPSIVVPYEPNRWYRIDLRDMHWSSGSYKVYVDGELVGAYVRMSDALPGINQLSVSSFTSETSYLDEIVFY